MASADRGNTGYMGPTQPQITSATDLSTPDQDRGLYVPNKSEVTRDDRSNTSFVGPRGSRAGSATDLSTPDQVHGIYGDSSTAVVFQDRDRGITTYIREELTQLPVSGSTVYKMTGYYGAGSAYESWVSAFPNIMPPSGHSLTFISYVVLAGGNAN